MKLCFIGDQDHTFNFVLDVDFEQYASAVDSLAVNLNVEVSRP